MSPPGTAPAFAAACVRSSHRQVWADMSGSSGRMHHGRTTDFKCDLHHRPWGLVDLLQAALVTGDGHMPGYNLRLIEKAAVAHAMLIVGIGFVALLLIL